MNGFVKLYHKTCNNDMGIESAYLCFNDFHLVLTFINIQTYYANKIIRIFNQACF